MSLRTKYGVIAELLSYLWKEKLWWMIPMVLVFAGFGALFLFTSSPAGLAIYTLF